MSVNRFGGIKRFLRFDDKRLRDVRLHTDKLVPISYVWKLFIEKCKKVYVPKVFVTIDQQLVSFRSHCGFVQYMPSKPGKYWYGLKIFWLCGAETGYDIDGFVYIRRNKGEPHQKNLAFSTVKNLVNVIAGKSRTLIIDNYFTSVSLAQYLLEKQITFVVTLR